MDGLIGEIRAFAFGYNPPEWIPCDGQLCNIMQYQALYSIIGLKYGGDQANFKVPDLRSYAVIGVGSGPGLTPRPDNGAAIGSESVILTNSNLPSHDHNVNGYTGLPEANFSNAPVPGSSFLGNMAAKNSAGAKTALNGYVDPLTNAVLLKNDSVSVVGPATVVPHENRSPFTTLNYCICCDGEYPQRP
jgi:microcystin-dependent protein